MMKQSQFASKIFFLCALLSGPRWYFEGTDAHSWLACSDYRGDVNYFEQDRCFGWARRWDDRGSDLTAAQPNGYQIAVESPDNRAYASEGCDRPLVVQGSPSWTDSYSTGFPHAIYEQGGVYCMAWSMQNHATAPEDCTNSQAKSDAAARDSLFLYISTVNPSTDPSQTEFFVRNINEVAGLAHSCDPNGSHYGTAGEEDRCQLGLEKQREPRDCKGFQRSPAFCENTGSAMGTGCFLVPEDLPTGHYVGQWYWNTTFVRPTYVQETAYKSCFDFEVVPSGDATRRAPELPPGTKGNPTGSLPCVNNVEAFEEFLQTTISTTNPPTTSPPPQNDTDGNSNNNGDSNCSPLYERCGGEGWNGPSCCVDGTECIELYTGWPQCFPTNSEVQHQQPQPQTEPPSQAPTQESCSPLHERCGGEGWKGPSCCVDGTECIELYAGWPQCLPTDGEGQHQQQQPQKQPPSQAPMRESCSPLWERCGGEAWTGPTCCQEGQCVEQHPNWFVCML